MTYFECVVIWFDLSFVNFRVDYLIFVTTLCASEKD